MSRSDDQWLGHCEDCTLSPTELQVLCLITAGLSDKEIAETLGKSWTTVRTHCSHILSKTACRNRVELARFAIKAGLVSVEWTERTEILQMHDYKQLS